MGMAAQRERGMMAIFMTGQYHADRRDTGAVKHPACFIHPFSAD
jgi:hypothetical protein